jgi:hypothetical protein
MLNFIGTGLMVLVLVSTVIEFSNGNIVYKKRKLIAGECRLVFQRIWK